MTGDLRGEINAKQPLIVILGPTAVGKTNLAIQLAQAVNGEIVGADSRQVYHYLDIGTAKPTAAEQALVRHHLVDFVDPAESLTVACYQQMAYAAIDDIHARGKVAFLVGGTGQYITAVTEGWTIPRVPPNAGLRAELETVAATQGAQALHDRLAQVDPVIAARTHPHNVRRIVRALEVHRETGVPISELQQKRVPPYTVWELGVTMERQQLYEWADQRVDRMMQAGFLEEVRRLLDMGYDRNLPSLSGLGYSQLVAHWLDGIPLEEAVSLTKFATHNFIRRQDAWFRGHNRGIIWHNREQIKMDDLFASMIQQMK